MKLLFEAISEDELGKKWRGVFDRHWHSYSRWFLKRGAGQRATYLDGLRAIKKYMPELLPAYQNVCDVAGGGDLESRFLSMWCPPAYIGGCSQVIVPSDSPSLIRNYDYSPELFEGTWLRSKLHTKKVISIVDCLWGCLDGLNDDGLAVSLAFGGRTQVGEGFGIPIVLRYVLEFASNVVEAVELLKRVPVHMSYSVALIDRGGKSAMIYLAPDRPLEIVDRQVATNHQHSIEWPRHAAATKSAEREATLTNAIKQQRTSEELLELFRQPPLHQESYLKGYGTLYTAAYSPKTGSVELFWPGRSWKQGFDGWIDGQTIIEFPS